MRIVKAPWVRHGENDSKLSIFSIDLHPDGSRFATGGQGHDCGRVVIWNMKPVRSYKDESDENVPLELCHLDNHLQCVNTVRWSNAGTFLASAGDDQLIMIWTLGGRYGQSETYRTVATLRSHTGDILDLSWSPDDKLLASCSVDNHIVIWNTQRWPEMITTLRGHTGLVKGVAFDPIGKYLASQSDDKSLRIWRVSDWHEEVVVRKPFEQCGGTTHVLRPSWSPDGQFLVSAQAMNNGGSVAKIIYRHDWSYEKDFVGHRKAIPCVRFNSNIFKVFKSSDDQNSDSKKASETGGKFTSQSIVAIGSRDRSISIWSTAHQRPLVVVADVFDNTVLDVSWSKAGYELLACSSDGQVIYLSFDKKELGLTYSQDERQVYLQQLYGNSIGNKSVMLNNLIEDVEIMSMLHTNTNNNKPNGVANHKDGDTSKNSSNTVTPTKVTNEGNNSTTSNNTTPNRLAKGPTDKQIEIRLNDGRRKIIPLFIPPTMGNGSGGGSGGAGGDSNPSGSTDHNQQQPQAFSSSRESKSTIVIEKHDESNSSFGYQQYLSTKLANGNDTSRLGVDETSMPADAANNNKVAGVKKRVRPISDESADEDEAPIEKKKKIAFVVSSSESSEAEEAEEDEEKAIVVKRSRPKQQVEKRKTKEAVPITTKQSKGDRPTENNNDKHNHRDSGHHHHQQQQQRPKPPPPTTTTTSVAVNNSMSSGKPIVFPVLKLSKQAHNNIRLYSTSDPKKVYTASIEYPLATNTNLCKLSVFGDSELCWSTVLPSALYAVVGNETFVACVCADRTVNIFGADTGKRLHTPIVLDAGVARVTCANKSLLLLITCQADLWLWDMMVPKAIIRRESLSPLLIHPRSRSEHLSIMNASVDGHNNAPVVTISNGRTYLYDFEMGTWTVVNDVHDPLNACTDLRPMLASTFSGRSFQSMPSRSLMNFFSTNNQISQLALVSFLDKQVEAAKVMGSSTDYRNWLVTLVQQLVSLHASGNAAINVESRLRSLCSMLLGKQQQQQQTKLKNKTSTPLPTNRRLSYGWPSGCAAGGNDSVIINNNNNRSDHDLLKEILSIMASNLGLQRLYTEYKDELDFVQSSLSVASTLSASMFAPHNAQLLGNGGTAVRPNTLKENITATTLHTPTKAQTSISVAAPTAAAPSPSSSTTPSLPPKPTL